MTPMADFLDAAGVMTNFHLSTRTLDRVGVPSYRITPRGKKLFKRSEIEAALMRNVSTPDSAKGHLDEIVDQTVAAVLSGLN